MIIVTGEVRFGDGEIERLRSVLVNAVEATREEAGCQAYSYAVDLLDPNLLRISELWERRGRASTPIPAKHARADGAAPGRENRGNEHHRL